MSGGSIIIVRHGRTAFNATGRLQGRTDNPLDEVGLEQARRVARYLQPEKLENALLICSPLLRARSTAGAIAEEIGVAIEIDDRWIELDYGTYEGFVQSDVPTEVWKAWRGNNDYAVPRGESLNQVQSRVALACEHLAERLEGRTAIVVTHVSPIKAAVAWALGTDAGVSWRTQLDTASITRITLSGNGPSLKSFNEIAR